MKTEFIMVFAMFIAYLIFRGALPRYAVIAALAIGILVAALRGLLHVNDLHWELAQPILTAPQFSANALIGVALRCSPYPWRRKTCWMSPCCAPRV